MMEGFVQYRSQQKPEHRLKCQYCSYSTYVTTNLKNHILTHTGEKRYVCDICGNRFTLKHHLKKHKSLHEKQL